MSLKAFHRLFIALSIVLAAFVAAWAVGEYRVAHDRSYIAAAVGSLGAAGLMAAYLNAFLKKTRRLS